MADPYETWDAAYVMGSLSPAERAEYDAHLRECDACTASVAELGGLPTLLRLADPSGTSGVAPAASAGAPPVAAIDQPPASVRSGLLGEIRRHRRRERRFLGGALLTAAASIVALVIVVVVPGGGSKPTTSAIVPPTATSSAGPPAAMTAVLPVPLRATYTLTGKKWGTAVHVNCVYDAGASEPARDYALAVKGTDSRWQTIGWWSAKPGSDSKLDSPTSLQVGQITAIEIRGPSGTPLLRANP